MVRLCSTARLNGDIETVCFITEEGAFFHGKCTMIIPNGGLTMIYREGFYRLWYNTLPEEKFNKLENTANMITWGDCLCYAESKDGFEWHKPFLGLCEYRGSRNNNIVFGGPLTAETGFHGGGVFIDSSARQEECYKMVFMGNVLPRKLEKYRNERPNDISPVSFIKNKVRGILGAVSPDGIHWSALPEPLVMHFSDTLNTAYYDTNLKRYVGYFRMFYCGRRAIGRSETNDFAKWPLPDPVLWPGASEESPSNDYYNNCKVIYPGTENTHIMFPAIYKRDSDSTEIRTYSSYDGLYWSRIPGQPLAQGGRLEEWDGGSLFASPGLVPLCGDRIALPFIGFTVPHKFPRTVPLGNLGYFAWKKERIAAVEAENEGEFYTFPFVCPGRSLLINAETLRAGFIRVELVDNEGNVIPGRSIEDCDTFTGDCTKITVSWKGETGLKSDSRMPIAFHFVMKAAKLYSFEIV